MSKPRKPEAQSGSGPRLRSAAEAQLARSSGTAPKLREKAPAAIIHKLQVHQIELEMQNEELQRAHLALEESRNRYLNLYEFAPVGYFTFTRGGRIAEVNLTGAVLLGVPRAKLIGRALGSFVAAEDRDPWERHRVSVLKSAGASPGPGEKLGCELKLQREDGSTFHARLESVWLERVSGQELAGTGGGSPIIRTALSDITNRKQAEEAVRVSEAEFRLVLEHSNDAIFWADAATGLIVRCNRKTEAITERTRAELIGMHVEKLHPPGPDYHEIFKRLAAVPSTENVEAEFISRTGKRTPAVVNFSVVTIGRLKIVQGIGRDVTERKRTEAYREMGREVLRILTEPGDLPESIRRVVAALKAGTGFDAVGLRLQDRDDFSYLAQEGFSQDFLRTENTLLARAPDGGVCRDKDGQVCLECTCGLVLSGRTDPANPRFTPRGSWWTNDSFPLLDLPPEEDARLHPRNKCIHQGYASVALVPIRNRDTIVGLIQFNERRKGCFSLNTVELLEGIAAHVGTALMRKKVEEALRAASEQRQLALKAAGMGAWDYRFDTGEVFWDERCRNQWGVAQGVQIDYAAVIAGIHPEDRAATEEAVKRALAGTEGGAYHREFRVVWPDGSVHWICSYGQVYFESEGERRRAVRFLGANRDISMRKGMEEAQEFLWHCGYQSSSENFFQALARFLAQSLGMDLVCIDHLAGDGLAAQTVAMYRDGKFEDNVSYALKDTPCGDVVGKTICCFPKDVRHVFPKDSVLQDLQAESYVGTTLWSLDGKPIGLIAVIGRKPLANLRLAESVLKLVTERAASELQRTQAEKALQQAHDKLEVRVQERTARLRQVVHRLRDEVRMRRGREQELTAAELRYRTVADFTYDWEYWETPEYVLRYCSPSCERITGYSAQEFMANPRLFQQIVHPEDAGVWQKHREESLIAPEPRLAQFRIRTKDGAVRWVEHACQPVLREDGVFLGIRASNRDVTDRKEEELKTQQLREELAHVTRVTTAGQLAASLAHELNQPLTAIHCNAETAQQFLAADPPNVAEVREALEDIAHDSQRAGGVIQRLRALFNKTGHNQSVLQINEIIHETLDLLHSEFVLKGISPQVHLEPALPGVLGDRIELQQVVLNLVVNAMEAMSELEPGQRHLQITTGCEGSLEIQVSVRDSGPGIEVQPISRVFEPFFTTKASGIGMGLAICQTILEAHSGSLRAVNNPDRGATFHLTLPIPHGENA